MRIALLGFAVRWAAAFEFVQERTDMEIHPMCSAAGPARS